MLHAWLANCKRLGISSATFRLMDRCADVAAVLRRKAQRVPVAGLAPHRDALPPLHALSLQAERGRVPRALLPVPNMPARQSGLSHFTTQDALALLD